MTFTVCRYVNKVYNEVTTEDIFQKEFGVSCQSVGEETTVIFTRGV